MARPLHPIGRLEIVTSLICFAQFDPQPEWALPSHSSEDDAATERSSRGGQSQRILQLYDECRESIYRYLLCMKLTPEAAEDIVHEAFLRLHQHLQQKSEKDQNLRAWTFRVAHNLAVSAKRRIGEVQVDLESVVSLGDARQPHGSSSPEDVLIKHELLLKVRRTVLRLPEPQQRCLHLRAEGLRYREISAILGMPIPTVAVQLQRAIARLMEECSE